MSLFEKMQGLMHAKKLSAAEEYRKLAHQVADGKAVKPEAALAIVDAAGKTLQDLQADSEGVNQRRVLASEYARLAENAREQQELRDKAGKAEAEFEAAAQRRDAVLHPAEARMRELETERQRISQHRGPLIATCDDPTLLARHRAAEEARALARRRLNEHEQERRLKLFDSETVALRSHPPVANALGEATRTDAYRRHVEELTKQVKAEAARLDREREPLEAALRRAEADLASIDDAMANWVG
jgi:hypothetical protein